VTLLFLAPLLVASNFFVVFISGDTLTTRKLLVTSVILTIVSLAVVAIWNLIYYLWLYKKDAFYSGTGPIDQNVYLKQNKRTFIFTMLIETVFLCVVYAYFMCVCSRYEDCMKGPATPPAAAEGDAKDEKASSKKDDEKKSDKKSEPKAEEEK